jgi:transmembrane 9 superfamily protein 2/4
MPCLLVCWQGLVAMILVRALHRDLSRYNRVATDEEKAEDKEETGWKLVHGDVFRPPTKAPLLFAAFVGVGNQVHTFAEPAHAMPACA